MAKRAARSATRKLAGLEAMKAQVSQALGEAIVIHLVGLVGANVEVKLEITADVPAGVPDDVVRTVTENAKTLRFEQHGFETD